MKEFFALLKARNIEYYRDKGSLAWAFVFPLLVIIGCALAFSNPDTSIFKVGVHGKSQNNLPLALLNQPYIKVIEFDELTQAQERIKHHQLDLLISPSHGSYWINSESSSSLAAKDLLINESDQFSQQALSGRKIRYVDWVIPGVLGMNLMFGALFGVGYVVVRYRRSGVLKRLQATPINALHFLSAQLVSRLIIVVLVNGIIFVGCNFFLDLIVLGSYLNLLLITLLGAFSMISIGLLVASRTANEELAGGLLNVATWPMLFLSEVWFSLDDAPRWMQHVADLMPLTHIVKASREVMIEGATLTDISDHLILMSILTIICLLMSAKLFRWNK
jgi:ABC-2 type transport system permease protein